MGMRMPETCWAVFKRQVVNLRNWCIWLVDSVECYIDLTFIGPCIVIYFYSKTNEMHQIRRFILFYNSTLHVSGGLFVHHQESKTVHSIKCMLNRFCWRFASGKVLASKPSAESVWHIPDSVCTVLDSWWWTERPSQTCRVLLQNEINLKNWCISLVLL